MQPQNSIVLVYLGPSKLLKRLSIILIGTLQKHRFWGLANNRCECVPPLTALVIVVMWYFVTSQPQYGRKQGGRSPVEENGNHESPGKISRTTALLWPNPSGSRSDAVSQDSSEQVDAGRYVDRHSHSQPHTHTGTYIRLWHSYGNVDTSYKSSLWEIEKWIKKIQ